MIEDFAMERIKRWEKHSFIFFAVGLCVGKKNESVFCALAKIFEGWLFLIKLFSAVALKAMSGRIISCQKNVQSKPVSSKIALLSYGFC